MSVIYISRDFIQEVFPAVVWNPDDIVRLVPPEKIGKLADIAVKGSLGYVVLAAKVHATDILSLQQDIVQKQHQFGFHFPSSSSAGRPVPIGVPFRTKLSLYDSFIIAYFFRLWQDFD